MPQGYNVRVAATSHGLPALCQLGSRDPTDSCADEQHHELDVADQYPDHEADYPACDDPDPHPVDPVVVGATLPILMVHVVPPPAHGTTSRLVCHPCECLTLWEPGTDEVRQTGTQQGRPQSWLSTR